MADTVWNIVFPALPSIYNTDLRCNTGAFCCFHAVIPSPMEVFSFLFEVLSSLFSCFESMIPVPLWNPRDPSLARPHASVHPSSLGQGNWCQSAVCGSCRRSINHWSPSLGQSIFTSNCPSSCGYLKLKWTLGGINIIWKGERDFWPLTLGCGATGGGGGGRELSFPCDGLGMSHDEPCADSLWWVIDPPLGSPSGRCLLASLARAY